MVEKSLIYVGGAQGTGKSTILKLLKLDSDAVIISGSQLVYELAYKELDKKFDELTHDEKNETRKHAISYICNLNNKLIVLDSHYVEFEKGHIKIIFPEELMSKVTHHIVIEANPSEVLNRRLNDFSKYRLNSNLNSIALEIEAERNIAQEMASKANVPFHILQNKLMKTCALELISLLRCDG